MWNVKTKVIPVTIGAIGTHTMSLRKSLKKYWETTKSRKYRKQPYWALRTYFGKY
jgi:hypothetical protein